MHFGLTGLAPLLLYFGAIAAFLASVFWRPEIGIYFLVPLFPLQTIRYRVHEYPLGNKLIDIVLLGVVLGALFRKDFKFKTPLNGTLLIFVLFYYVSLFNGALNIGKELPWSIEDPRFSTWKNYMIMPLVFVAVACVIREVKQIKIVVVLMCASALLACKSYHSNLPADLTHFSYSIRDGAVFGYAGANGAGAFFSTFALLLLAMFVYQKNILLKLPIAAIAAFCIDCLMYTYSRGAYLALLLGSLILTIVKDRRLLIVLIVFLFTWESVVPQSVQERVLMTYDESDNQLDASAAERVTLWEDATTLVPQYPLFGTGFNTYEYMRRVTGIVLFKDTHNYYLKVVVETGLIGLALFLWLVFRMFGIGYKLFVSSTDPFLKSLGIGMVLVLIGTLVNSTFGDRWTYIEEAGFLWVLLGCAVRGLAIVAAKAQEDSADAPDAEQDSVDINDRVASVSVSCSGTA